MTDAETGTVGTPTPTDPDLRVATAPTKPEVATIDDLLDRPRPSRTLAVPTARGERAITLQALTREAYDAVIAANPPDPDKHKDAIGLPTRWNLDTFPTALVAACLIEPVLSEAEVAKLWEVWPRSDSQRLYVVAIDLNEESEIQPILFGSAGTSATGDS